jgi:hypothetical protein
MIMAMASNNVLLRTNVFVEDLISKPGQRVEISQFHRVVPDRVARWFVFKPKIPNLGQFWRALEW